MKNSKTVKVMRLSLLAAMMFVGLNASAQMYELKNTELKARIFIKDGVKSAVKDPYSLKFGQFNFNVVKREAVAYYVFHAKNSLGAYVKNIAYVVIQLNSDGSIKSNTPIKFN